ncbi:MAG TPA: hypothetical protein PLH72_14020 [Vicinamibacterales bacterium]|nr:hypothetical protein [Vicinamibacterales bacterium]
MKLLAAGSVAAALVAIEGIGTGSALNLTVSFIAAAAALLWTSGRAFGTRPPAAGFDWLCLAVTGLSATFPFVIAAAVTGSGWDLALLAGVAALGLAALWRRNAAVHHEVQGPALAVPAGVYVLAAIYVLWSIAAPFGHFNDHSLVREMYTDGFQRFGVIYALGEHVPPSNPFVAGLPLRYYWFSLAPIAALAQATGVTAFDAWKAVLTWQAFAFVVTLWWVTATIWGGRAAAWAACVLAFVTPSAEMLWHPSLRQALSLAGTSLDGARRALATLAGIDPDHVVGVLVPHSDQILMEDFLYIPQNAAALGLFVVVVWLVARRYWLAAAWVTALYVGTNTFFLIPGSLALAATIAAEAGVRRAAAAGFWMAGWAIVWAVLCRVLSPPGASGPLVGLAIAGLAGWAWLRLDRTREPSADLGHAGRLAAAALLAAWGYLVWMRPAEVVVGLVANYSPAILLAFVVVVGRLAGRGHTGAAGRAELTILWFAATFCLVTAALVAPFWGQMPAWGTEAAFRLGDVVNPFNFYHKVAKGVRIGWCLLAAVAAAPAIGWLGARQGRAVVASAAAIVLVPVFAATTIVRPLTYLRDEPGREAPAADLLRRIGASLDTVVLLEDFRTSQINQLAPVSTFFISSWSGGARSLSNAAGTWADQYVPTTLAPEVAERERLNQEVFASPDSAAAILRLRGHYRIDYVLTRERRDWGHPFVLLVDWPGGYLYAIRPGRTSRSPGSAGSSETPDR